MTTVAGTSIERLASPAGPLARLEQARRDLEHASTVDEIKDIRDKAEALRQYAKKAKLGLETQNTCALLKLDAERKAGAMLDADPRFGYGKWGPRSVTVTDLGLDHNQSKRWQAVARIPDREFEAYVETFTTPGTSRELTTSGALKLERQLRAVTDRTTPRRADWSPPGSVPEAFTTVIADPPWQYANVATRGAAGDHYSTMKMDELKALDLDALDGIDGVEGLRVPIAPDAHLYLWVTNSFLREGFDLMDAWGFTYKTCLTWVKPQIGLGNYFRNNTEHVLFGVKGRLPTLRDDVPTWFQADRARHSAKPGCFYDLVGSSSPGPYLEMFARAGGGLDARWHVWGHQA